ncbi:TetR/AcrR family transcriptional regulator [Jejubacter calystegiae]|uniref:TetR/AcrR family transcriptional regulator n=1 Tax=Jejubacter calystegiae TaxID=2579935 RepID=A0A4P8YHD3_9ENTR|nr:TetR/AcrR family transcriptional regulator [Jejubacter calystegiae]QCT19990.1 TetR/AcrR family transcriptional regulator [Jejubacter calystegiae]
MTLAKKKSGKAEILTTAKIILSEKGARNFSMREVARACGKSLSNVQYYYPSLEELLSALFEDVIDDSIQKLNEVIVNDGEELKWLVDLIISNFNDVTLCKLIWEAWVNSANCTNSSYALHDFYIKYIEQVKLIILRKIPDMRDDLAKQKAVMCVALFEGLSVLYTVGKNTFIDFDVNDALYTAAYGIINVE